jgi:type I restriction enzyme S subunit
MAAEWRACTINEIKADDERAIAIGPFGSRMKADRYVAEGVPVIRGNNISDTRTLVGDLVFVSEETADELRSCNVFPGDLVFPHRGAIGQVGIVPKDERGRYVLSTSMMKLTCNQALVDPLFVFYFFRSELGRHALLQHASTVGTPGIGQPLSSLRSITLPVPPLPEQRAIAHVLGTLDDKIELNRRMNETLEAIARALFKSWFVDFDPVRAKAEGRDPGLPKPLADLFPASLVDSELGEIPQGWEVHTLEKALSDLEVGGRPKGGVSGYIEGVPSIGAESIVGLGIFDYSKTKYVPREFFQAMTKGHVRSRDVLLYKDGGRPGEFEPHVTLVGDGFPYQTCAINEHVYRLRAKATLGQNFLFFWLSSDIVMEEMRIKGTGVAIPGLNSTQVKSLTTLAPASKVVRAFDAIADPLITRLLASCNESRTLATVRDALLPRLISGELRIADATAVVEATQ